MNHSLLKYLFVAISAWLLNNQAAVYSIESKTIDKEVSDSAVLPQGGKQVLEKSYAGTLDASSFKSVWDFGYVPIGYKVVYKTSLKNIGKDTLQVLDLLSTCECTVARLDNNTVPPGDSSQMTVTFDTEKFSGSQSRFVEVNSTDSHAPQRLFQFKANVGGRPESLAMLPQSLLILSGRQGDSLVIKNYSDKDIPFKVSFLDSKLFSLDAEHNFIPAEGYTHFYLKINDSVPKGEHYSTLTLEFKTNEIVRISTPIKLIRR